MSCADRCNQGRKPCPNPSLCSAVERFTADDFDDSDFLRQEGALHAAIRALFVLVGIAGLCGALLFWLGAVGVIDLKGIFL